MAIFGSDKDETNNRIISEYIKVSGRKSAGMYVTDDALELCIFLVDINEHVCPNRNALCGKYNVFCDFEIQLEPGLKSRSHYCKEKAKKRDISVIEISESGSNSDGFYSLSRLSL